MKYGRQELLFLIISQQISLNIRIDTHNKLWATARRGLTPDFTPDFNKRTTPNLPPSLLNSSEIIKITDIKRIDLELILKILVYDLLPSINFMLVSNYQNYKDRPSTPDSDEYLPKTIFKLIPRKEIHVWLLIDGVWMKKEGSYIFLNQ